MAMFKEMSRVAGLPMYRMASDPDRVTIVDCS